MAKTITAILFMVFRFNIYGAARGYGSPLCIGYKLKWSSCLLFSKYSVLLLQVLSELLSILEPSQKAKLVAVSNSAERCL